MKRRDALKTLSMLFGGGAVLNLHSEQPALFLEKHPDFGLPGTLAKGSEVRELAERVDALSRMNPFNLEIGK